MGPVRGPGHRSGSQSGGSKSSLGLPSSAPASPLLGEVVPRSSGDGVQSPGSAVGRSGAGKRSDGSGSSLGLPLVTSRPPSPPSPLSPLAAVAAVAAVAPKSVGGGTSGVCSGSDEELAMGDRSAAVLESTHDPDVGESAEVPASTNELEPAAAFQDIGARLQAQMDARIAQMRSSQGPASGMHSVSVDGDQGGDEDEEEDEDDDEDALSVQESAKSEGSDGW